MQPLFDHARFFGRRPEDFASLAQGHSPQVLFITCSGSRVVPAPITGARPGELFEPRTAGNVVPPYIPGRPAPEAATAEHAVDVPGVRGIMVCGHSHRGAVGALVRGEDLTALPAPRDWLARAEHPAGAADHDPAGGVRHHVRAQPLRPRAYPCVRRALNAGRLRLHGWYPEAHTGAVSSHRPDTDTFEAL